jgi:predicted N-formylglutamate amidohydrolase
MHEAVESIPGRRDAGVLFICDHASNAVPAELGGLGLAPEQFQRHIAYDIGAADVTRALASDFEAPAVLSRFSRLVIDANRGSDDPTLVMRLSDGAVIPGNAQVGAAEVERRTRLYWRPYREAIAAEVAAMTAAGPVPAIVSLHSFTPVWKGFARPWEVAVLWDRDPRLAAPLIAALAGAGLAVGDNEPYDGALRGDTLHDLATRAGLAHALIEARQDLVATADGARAFAEKIAAALRPVLARPEAHIIERHGSRTDRPRRSFPS